MSPGTGTERSARVSTSRQPTWRVERWCQLATGIWIAALSWWYFSVHQQPSANNYRTLVMWLGWIGILLAILAAALSTRKRMAYQGVGKLSSWLRAHIYLGVSAAFAIFYHSGLRSGGPLTAVLSALFWFTVASGLLGWWISRTVPPFLTAMEEKPAILEDLLTIRSESIAGVLELAAGATAEFRALVNRRLLKDAMSWKHMLRFYQRRSTFAQELPAFQKEYEPALLHLRQHEHRAFRRAIEYALRANKMNAELFLQRLLRGWLTLHIVCTMAMFGFATIHIIAVLYY